MTVRIMIIALFLLLAALSGCAANPRGTSAAAKPSPEAEARVRRQIEWLTWNDGEVLSVERAVVAGGQRGWRITHRVIDQTFSGPHKTVRWLELGEEGYLVSSGPPNEY